MNNNSEIFWSSTFINAIINLLHQSKRKNINWYEVLLTSVGSGCWTVVGYNLPESLNDQNIVIDSGKIMNNKEPFPIKQMRASFETAKFIKRLK